ncbi:hypothetical protein MSG28_005743 [Choristoneura fumiferana]|uniref:Uncharacterized protein n=1 Tax=Choristoneura fumiferana TaxID=7141 RepID=A0ACC0L030_CHOFU|nr:hypothetical protein MSG28_005743 [Choristoneura fumiferana]
MNETAMNGDDNINDFLPSILNPRTIKKENVCLTQNAPLKKQLFNNLTTNESGYLNSTASRISSIRKEKDLVLVDERNKENNCNLNATDTILTTITKRHDFFTDFDLANASTVDLLSLQDQIITSPIQKSNINVNNWELKNQFITSVPKKTKVSEDQTSLDFSVFEDLANSWNPADENNVKIVDILGQNSLKSGSSATELSECDAIVEYDLNDESYVAISFGVSNCKCVDVTTKNSCIKRLKVTNKDNNINVDCELKEFQTLSCEESELDENMNETVSPNLQKRAGVAVNLEIKKKKPSTEDAIENSKVLILKTDAIEKLSHVIVQPPNYTLVKRQIFDRNKFQSISRNTVGQAKDRKNGKSASTLRQIPIDCFLAKDKKRAGRDDTDDVILVSDDETEMSKNIGVADALKCDRGGRALYKFDWKGNESPRAGRVQSCKTDTISPKRQDVKPSSSEAPRAPSLRAKNESISSHSPRKNVEAVPFNMATKTKSGRASGSARSVPYHKIVAGTHYAVDAFSYGDIPNVKHYFLTHFHSDHYSGLKKSFNKLLYCSEITGDLCVSRLGVNPKCIHVLTLDNTIRIEGDEVTAVDANHCPGAVMLIFALSIGKTVLHTGDFRANPAMESYPLFWNTDIHTIYLDTTYCNSRYDFPTQDQSLEMALSLLRQKKMALEKVGKKFSSVLIVCGTYTIGKEKFFLGMARRVGCSVWACPEKDKVLQAVEGRSFSHAPAQSCQLHVVPMRDLSIDKLKSYLESLHGTFTEVVAFKPSGWENGKNSTVEKDNVTIHGIPYSEHSSFSELVRFVNFLKPKQVVPTVGISGGIKAVQKYFPCPLVCKEEIGSQSKVTDYYSIQNRQQMSAVT